MRANKMCPSCPFRGADDAYKQETAGIEADEWPCHSEQMTSWDTDIQCRGHFEARRKFPNEVHPGLGGPVMFEGSAL